MTNLLTTSDNASSSAVSPQDSRARVIVAYGTFGGGTLTLEYSVDGSNYESSGKTLTATGSIEFREQPGVLWRVTLSGPTAGSVTADYA